MKKKRGGERVYRMIENGPLLPLLAPTQAGIADREETDCVLCGRATLSAHGLCPQCEAREYGADEL